MNLRLGQRVKKVRGAANLGTTGVVYTLIPKNPSGYDIVIATDQGVLGDDGIKYTRPVLLASFSDEWEPIVPDGLQASEYTMEDLLTSADPYIEVPEGEKVH